MPKNSIVKAQETLQRAHSTLARAREKSKTVGYNVVQRGAVVISAAGMAEIEQHVAPVFLKIPTKIWLTGIALGIGIFTKGYISRIAMGVGDGIGAVYAYKAAYQVKNKKPSPMVAGENGYIEEP